MQLRSATAGIAVGGVQILRAIDNAVHILHGKGNAGPAVILEDGQADDHVAEGKRLGEPDGCAAVGGGLRLVAVDL